MIIDAARLALVNLFAAETRAVFWKVLGLTLVVLVGLWFGLRSLFIAFALPWIDAFLPGIPDWAGWLSFVFAIFAGIGLALALALLISPVTALIAGLFLDDVALLLLFVPGVNLVAFFLVNGYLLGREFFEFAAMRFRTPAEARDYRARHGRTVFAAGLLIAAFLAIPIVNLLTPLFAAALMVHLHKMLSKRDGFA